MRKADLPFYKNAGLVPQVKTPQMPLTVKDYDMAGMAKNMVGGLQTKMRDVGMGVAKKAADMGGTILNNMSIKTDLARTTGALADQRRERLLRRRESRANDRARGL